MPPSDLFDQGQYRLAITPFQSETIGICFGQYFSFKTFKGPAQNGRGPIHIKAQVVAKKIGIEKYQRVIIVKTGAESTHRVGLHPFDTSALVLTLGDFVEMAAVDRTIIAGFPLQLIGLEDVLFELFAFLFRPEFVL